MLLWPLQRWHLSEHCSKRALDDDDDDDDDDSGSYCPVCIGKLWKNPMKNVRLTKGLFQNTYHQKDADMSLQGWEAVLDIYLIFPKF